MVVKKMLSFDQIVSEIKSEVEQDDWDLIKNQDKFVRTHYTWAVSDLIPYDQLNYGLEVLPVKNGIAQIPEGVRDFVGVYGLSTKDDNSKTRERWYKDIVGHMQRATDGCVYTVMRDCDECTELTCDTPIVLAAKDFEQQLGIGDKRWLYRHHWGHGQKSGMMTDPYTNRFMVMSPNRSKFFERGGGDKMDSINFHVEFERNKRYEYLVNEDRFEVGFEEGFILLSYKGLLYDDTRNRMLKFPYHEAVIRAIIEHVIYRLYVVLFRRNPGKYQGQLQLSQGLRQEAMMKAEIEMNKIGFHDMVTIVASVRSRQYGSGSFLDRTSYNLPNWVRLFDNKLRG